MFRINKNQTPKIPRPDWALLKGGQTYRAHMGKGFTDGVLFCARDM